VTAAARPETPRVPRPWSVPAVAKHFGVTRSTINRWVVIGKIKASPASHARRIYIPESEVLRLSSVPA
jgi:predicted site-specific integrase-resolvase